MTSAFGVQAAVEHARAAELYEFGGVWLAEHHFVQYGRCPSATVLAATILQATEHITVGTAACVFSARHPISLAHEALLLHELYGDRFALGVARGGPGIENDLIGGGMDRYHNGFSEWLDTLLHHLGGAMPVWVAATGPATAQLAAERGLRLMLGVERPIDEPCDAKVVLAYPGAEAERELRHNLPLWLARKDPHRDWTDHVERLLRVNPIGPPDVVANALSKVARPLCMVEAAGSIDGTTRLMKTLASLTHGSGAHGR
ncbi:LLM class flavin-dependent oxidoreductase [Allorhizocola rhizosphaerae]|uniref:LLM class flavin-dependent oxidoreductase n=1 Tax=Allorhizocola rhizosphaerae TaxID=1872709 RepID=UPI0013C2D9F8|nr:LLM class flavin-dependent oxidoreductase [Allorhizocola rhizosphaerae]